MTGSDDRSIRASDADRDGTATRLRVAVNEGRLSLDEFDERLRGAYAAVTRGDLEPLTADLPAQPSDPAQPSEAIRSSDPTQSSDQVRSAGQAQVAGHSESAEAARKQRHRRKLSKEWRDWAGTSVILIGIWGVISLVTLDVRVFWPAFPIGIWAVVLLAGMLFGDDDDDGDQSSDRS